VATGTGKYVVDSGDFSISRQMFEITYRLRDPGLAANPCPNYGDIYVLMSFGQDDDVSRPKHIVHIYDDDTTTLNGPQVIHIENSHIFDSGGFGSYWQATTGDKLNWLSAPDLVYDDDNLLAYLQMYAATLDLSCPNTWTLGLYPRLPTGTPEQAVLYSIIPGYAGPYGCADKLFTEYQVDPDGNFTYMRDADDFSAPWTLIHTEALYPDNASGGTTNAGYDLRAARQLPGGRIVLLYVGGPLFPTGVVQNFTLTSDNGGASWTKTDLPDAGFVSVGASTWGSPVAGTSFVIPSTATDSSANFVTSTDGQTWSAPVIATRSGGAFRQYVNPNGTSGALIGRSGGGLLVCAKFDPTAGFSFGGFDYRTGAALGSIAGNDFAGIGPLYDSGGVVFLFAKDAVYDAERDVWWVVATNQSATPSLVEHYLLKFNSSFSTVTRIQIPTATRYSGTAANYPLSIGKFPPQSSQQP
jgi:hypothetical protein